MDTAFIAIASLLWAFEFKKARDENGEEIVPDDTAYTDVFIMLVDCDLFLLCGH